VDHDPLAAPGGADPDVEPFVVVDEDLDVVVLPGADAVAHHPERPFLVVGLDVPQVGAVARPRDPGPRGVGDLVVEIALVGDVANSQRVVLVSPGVGRPGHESVIGAHLERGEVEELVGGPLGVLVEYELFGGRLGRLPPAVDRIRLPFLGAGRVEPAVDRDRRGDVGLLHPRADLLEQLLDELRAFVEPCCRVGVLGFEIGDGVGVVAIAQPGVGVVDVAAGAMPRVGLLLGDRRGHRRTVDAVGRGACAGASCAVDLSSAVLRQ
jgi:hypothetical protein